MSGINLEIDNLPNRLTIFRVLLIPIILGSLLLRSFDWHSDLNLTFEWIAAWTFAVAATTDFVDGYVARKRNIVTVFGSFLDPIADKFLTISSLIMLQELGRIHVVVVIILVLREVYMTSLRLLAVTQGINVAVNAWGKWKTALQLIGIPLLMTSYTCYPFGGSIPVSFPITGKVLIYIASFLALYSSALYSAGLVGKLKQLKKIKRQGLIHPTAKDS